jgi:hypothetical protein
MAREKSTVGGFGPMLNDPETYDRTPGPAKQDDMKEGALEGGAPETQLVKKASVPVVKFAGIV